MSYLNDIYSYKKELKTRFKRNLFYKNQKYFNCTSKEAMNISIKIFQKEKEIFDKTSTELIGKYSSNESIKLSTSSYGFYELYGEIRNQIDKSNYFSDELFRENKCSITAIVYIQRSNEYIN